MSAGYSASAQTSAEQRAHEPSMEEILASIRKIIADDQILPLSRRAEEPAVPAAAPVAPQPARNDDLAASRPPMRRERFGFRDEQPAANAAPAPATRPQQRAAIPRPAALDEFDALTRSMTESALQSDAQPAPPPPAPVVPPAPVEASRLLSPTTDAQLATSFGALNTTVMLQESGVIEDSVKEMLRPMLKQWLDDNLPGIVERLVRQEIERVARGRR